MSTEELQAEIERLHAFALKVAEHLYLAACVLAHRAERRGPKRIEEGGA